MSAGNLYKEFNCQQCGICCRWTGHVLLTDADITRLAAAVELSEDELIERYTVLAVNRRQLSLTEGEDGGCIFLEDTQCAQYDARPEQCRSFPHAWRVAEGCPALDLLNKEACFKR